MIERQVSGVTATVSVRVAASVRAVTPVAGWARVGYKGVVSGRDEAQGHYQAWCYCAYVEADGVDLSSHLASVHIQESILQCK
jgi:hypothetical protein